MIDVTWMIDDDIPDAWRILGGEFSFPDCDKYFMGWLDSDNHACIISQLGDEITGVVVLENEKEKSEIILMGVSMEYRRQGIGSALIDRVKSLVHGSRDLFVLIDETELDSHLFLAKMGFTATVESSSEEYRFEFKSRGTLQ
jgi:ribosomal protein S18 acetylase RimI-like enzyme